MKKILILEKNQIKELHRLIAEATGGDSGIRDEGLLESALYSAFASFGGEEMYPTVEEKAARLGYSLISNHAFLDGNKRIGLLCALVFLSLNGKHLKAENKELSDIALAVAAGQSGYAELLDFIRSKI